VIYVESCVVGVSYGYSFIELLGQRGGPLSLLREASGG
jgi:hypothetical protein